MYVFVRVYYIIYLKNVCINSIRGALALFTYARRVLCALCALDDFTKTGFNAFMIKNWCASGSDWIK
jgi:hypothetical protein